jgi:hypothetical protein
VAGRDERIGLNEALFRELNERAVEREIGGRGAQSLEIYCECADLDCIERIVLTAEEYAAVRSEAAQFAVRPGHEVRDAEDVVTLNDRFEIVRKRGDAGDVARSLDSQ